jgi:hypothetical protein
MESFGNKGKWVSHRRNWRINKNVKMQPVVLDTKEQLLSYDQEKFWIRFETESKLYIYTLGDTKLLNSLRQLPCFHCNQQCQPFSEWKKKHLGIQP